jgi:hypothetical protein
MTEPTEQDKCNNRLTALSLEYSTLRTEMLDRMTRRAQTVSVLAVAAALIAGFGVDATAISAKEARWLFWVLVVLAVGKWVRDGWTLGKLSRHVAQVEHDINDVLAWSFEASSVMRWETSRQKRTVLSWPLFGPRGQPIHRK